MASTKSGTTKPFKKLDVISMFLHSSACQDCLEHRPINRPQLALRQRCRKTYEVQLGFTTISWAQEGR